MKTGRGAGREDLVVSQCCHVCQRSVRFGPWLVRADLPRWVFHLFAQEMLFDLAADPYEQQDLATARPEVCREGAWRLMRWHDAQMTKGAVTGHDVADPLWTVMHEGGPFHARMTRPGNPGGFDGIEKYIARLEKTGRAEGAAKVREMAERYRTQTSRAVRVGGAIPYNRSMADTPLPMADDPHARRAFCDA